jgi:tetratricopeptide (TPR) repeat protein
MLADLYMNSNKTAEALKLYDKILELEPGNGYAHFAYADYYNGENDEANWYKHTLLGMQSTNVEVKTKLAILVNYIANGKADGHRLKCYELADAFAKGNPQEATAHMVIGDLYVQDKLFKEARYKYQRAVELEPNTLVAWQQMIYCSGEMRDNKLLQSDCEKAIEYFPMEVLFFAYHCQHTVKGI